MWIWPLYLHVNQKSDDDDDDDDELTHLWACDEIILELEFQQKGNKQTKKGLIVSKLLQFYRQEWIQKIVLFECYTEKDKNKNWRDLSLLGQEPTFKRNEIQLID